GVNQETTSIMRTYLFGIALLAGLGCASGRARPAQAPAPAAAAPAPRAPATAQTHAAAESSSVDRAQYPSTYQRHPNPPVLIRNATILTAAGQEIANGSILFKDGRIVAVGATVQAPADAVVVDGTGKYVTPGLIDDHSHLGVYAAPGTEAPSFRPSSTAAAGTSGTRTIRAISRRATCVSSPSPRCCGGTSTFRTTVIAPTRWRR